MESVLRTEPESFKSDPPTALSKVVADGVEKSITNNLAGTTTFITLKSAVDVINTLAQKDAFSLEVVGDAGIEVI